MKGYKVFTTQWKDDGNQYKVGETYEEDTLSLFREGGFCFFAELKDCCFCFSYIAENIIAEVKALGHIYRGEDDKYCYTNKIKIVREIPQEELLKEINVGIGNLGIHNKGDYNQGKYNNGDCNHGNENNGGCNYGGTNNGDGNYGNANNGNHNYGFSNNGDCNYGGCNNGNYNRGCDNNGNNNNGCNNDGNYNNGDWNKTDFANGCFNTKESKILMFNEPSDWTFGDWWNSEARHLLKEIKTYSTTWVSSDRMTYKEKEQHPEHEITGGYLKKSDGYGYNQIWWKDLSNEDKKTIKSLPNFNAVIFKEITGIDITR